MDLLHLDQPRRHRLSAVLRERFGSVGITNEGEVVPTTL